MRRMRLALAGVAALALCAAACSGGEKEQEADRSRDAADSARISILVTSSTSERPFEASCSGIADYARSRSRLVCDYADNTSTELIETKGRTYLRRISNAGSAGTWTESTVGDEGALARSPARLLATMRSAATREDHVGEEDVGGETTVHSRLTVDRRDARLLGGPGETAVDIWLADGLLRRISFEEGGERQTMEFFDFGIEVDVAPPPLG
jgi:hypothetical protein